MATVVTTQPNWAYNNHNTFIPWALTITVFGLWGLLKVLSYVFGGQRHHARNRGAVAAPAAGAPGYGPGVGANVGPVGAGAAAGPVGGWYKNSRYVSDGLETLLWLMLIPTLVNTLVGGFHNDHTIRNLIISIFSIGLFWVFFRAIGHIPVLGFLHRFVDLLLLPLVILAIAAASKGISDFHND
jgi:hypothetical protein